jgi:hypothetical protein
MGNSSDEGEDRQLSIEIGRDPAHPEHLQVVLENSVFKAVIRVHEGGEVGIEHAIRDWIVKSIARDQVDLFIDACAQRPYCGEATLMASEPGTRSVELVYGDDEFINRYTLFDNSPVIKVEYVKYDNERNGWCNTVDIGTPGGLTARHQATTQIYGQEGYIRTLNYHEDSYWNTFDGGEYEDDPIDGGALNYRDHMIMVVGDPETGAGFGRVMPIFKDGEQGGIKILKLLWDRGFETFPATGKDQTHRPSFVGYIFVFDDGLESAIESGKSIVDKIENIVR